MVDVIAQWRGRLAIRYLATGQSHGLPVAGNIGLRAALGRWICLFDDTTLPFADHIDVLLRYAQKHDAEGVYAQPFMLTECHTVMKRSIATVLFAREVFLRLGGFSEDGGVDSMDELAFRYLSKADVRLIEKSTVWLTHPCVSRS